MSVVVIGMDYPEHCVECKLRHSGIHDFCIIEERDFDDEDCDDMERNDWHPDWCPLRPFPEKHGRLISADEAYDRIMEQEGGNYIDMDGVGMGLDECRTIVEAEGDD